MDVEVEEFCKTDHRVRLETGRIHSRYRFVQGLFLRNTLPACQSPDSGSNQPSRTLPRSVFEGHGLLLCFARFHWGALALLKLQG